MSDPQQLAETIRPVLNQVRHQVKWMDDGPGLMSSHHSAAECDVCRALAALAALLARVETAEHDAQEFGPFFFRDACRVVDLPENASLDSLMERMEQAVSAEARLAQATEALRRATYLAEGLWKMVDRETWRATGGDDMQGHYEGDYHAENTLTEIRALAALVVDGREGE